MPIKILRCYDITTEESAAEGEYADSGVMGESLMTAREIAAEIRGGEPSHWPCRRDNVSAHTWITLQLGQDPYTGAYRQETIHLADPRPSALRAWRAALVAAKIAS